MKALEVSAVQCDHGPLLGPCEREHFLVGKSLIGAAGVGHRLNVVAESTEFHDGRQREVLVGEESRHALRRFVRADLLVDLASV